MFVVFVLVCSVARLAIGNAFGGGLASTTRPVTTLRVVVTFGERVRLTPFFAAVLTASREAVISNVLPSSRRKPSLTAITAIQPATSQQVFV